MPFRGTHMSKLFGMFIVMQKACNKSLSMRCKSWSAYPFNVTQANAQMASFRTPTRSWFYFSDTKLSLYISTISRAQNISPESIDN